MVKFALSWPVFSMFTHSLHSLPMRLIYMGAGAEKSAIQLNGIAQERETTYKALLLMLILRKRQAKLSLCLSYYLQRTTLQYDNE